MHTMNICSQLNKWNENHFLGLPTFLLIGLWTSLVSLRDIWKWADMDLQYSCYCLSQSLHGTRILLRLFPVCPGTLLCNNISSPKEGIPWMSCMVSPRSPEYYCCVKYYLILSITYTQHFHLSLWILYEFIALISFTVILSSFLSLYLISINN